MKLRAHVPTQSFGFIEIEGSPEEAKEIERLYNHYAETPVAFKDGMDVSTFKKIECLVGGSILYDDVNHIYMNEKGEKYLSGSTYAKQFDTSPFNAEDIANKMSKKTGVPAPQIIELWKLKGSASASFGTAIHEAMEMFGKYAEVCKTLEKEYHLSAIPMVNEIVANFFKGRENETAFYEPMVVDHDKEWAGQIDRLLVIDAEKKIARVQDYKTNTDLTAKKIEAYWHQLDFYSQILEAHGWTIPGNDIFHLDGEWKVISKERK